RGMQGPRASNTYKAWHKVARTDAIHGKIVPLRDEVHVKGDERGAVYAQFCYRHSRVGNDLSPSIDANTAFENPIEWILQADGTALRRHLFEASLGQFRPSRTAGTADLHPRGSREVGPDAGSLSDSSPSRHRGRIGTRP